MSIVRLVIAICLCNLSNSAHSNVYMPPYRHEPPEMVSPILHAAYHGRIDKVTSLLNENHKLLEKNLHKWPTLLGMAVIKNNLKMVQLILERMGHGNKLIEIGDPSFDSSPLRLAVQQANEEIVALLISYGADASAVNSEGRSILHDAVDLYIGNSYNIVKLILIPQNRVKTNIIDSHGNLPMFLAIKRGDINVVKSLKDAEDYNPTTRGGGGNSVFHIAAAFLKIACLKALDIPGEDRSHLDQRNRSGNTALHIAASKANSINTLEWLMNHGASSILRNKYGQTALHVSAMNGLVSAVPVLAPNNGALINAIDSFLRTPLHYAAENLFPEVVEELITHGAQCDMKVENEKVELHLATAMDPNPLWLNREVSTFRRPRDLNLPRFNERRRVIETLLAKTYEPQLQDSAGRTALHIAVRNKLVEVAKLLIRRTDLDAKDSAGETVLITACRNDVVDIVPSILSDSPSRSTSFKKKNNNLRDNNHKTALDYAVQRGCLRICQLLLNDDAAPDINFDPECGPTPLHTAVQRQFSYIVEMLVARIQKANIDHRNSEGYTALHLAAAKSGRRLFSTKIVNQLLSAGAQPDARDSQGNTALHLAINNMNNVYVLLKHGASTRITNRREELPIHLAARESDTEIINKLIISGEREDLQKRDCLKRTPLDHAVHRCYSKGVESFILPGIFDQRANPPEYMNMAHQLAIRIAEQLLDIEICKDVLKSFDLLFGHSEVPPEPQQQSLASAGAACAHPPCMPANAGASSSSVSDSSHSRTSSTAAASSSQAVSTKSAKRKSLASTTDKEPAPKKQMNFHDYTEHQRTLMPIKTEPQDTVSTITIGEDNGENPGTQDAASTQLRGGEANTHDERSDHTEYQGTPEAIKAEPRDNLPKDSETGVKEEPFNYQVKEETLDDVKSEIKEELDDNNDEVDKT